MDGDRDGGGEFLWEREGRRPQVGWETMMGLVDHDPVRPPFCGPQLRQFGEKFD
jgi:hypothetical protein